MKCLPCGLEFSSKTSYKTHRWKVHSKKGPDINESEWVVLDIKNSVPFEEILSFVEKNHYAKGASRTAVYAHGLFKKSDTFTLMGVSLWLPPTRNACESVNRKRWRRVLALSRLVIDPSVPRGGASFFLKESISIIKAIGDYVSLVTYADESQNHTGYIYEKSGWTRSLDKPTETYRWVDKDGHQGSVLSTTSRSEKQMRDLGFEKFGPYKKYKFTIHFPVLEQVEVPVFSTKGTRVEFISNETDEEFVAWNILKKIGVNHPEKYDVQIVSDSRLRVPIDAQSKSIYVLFDHQDNLYTAIGWITPSQKSKKVENGNFVFQGFELNPMNKIPKDYFCGTI